MDILSEYITLSIPNNTTVDFLRHRNNYGRTNNYGFFIIYMLCLCFAVRPPPKIKVVVDCITIIFRKTVAVILSIIFLPILFVILSVFTIYRLLISLNKFGGLFSGTDAFWAIEDESKGIINVLFIVQYDNDPRIFYNLIRNVINEAFFQKPDRFPKLLSTSSEHYGYYYLVKNEVTLDDCVKKLKTHEGENLNQEGLMGIVSEYSNLPLPKNHTALWEVLIAEQPLEWVSKSGKCYPVVFRINHSLGDGAALLEILVKVFADQPKNLRKGTRDFPDHRKFSTRKAFLNALLNNFQTGLVLFKSWWKNINVLIEAPVAILFNVILKRKDKNMLHVPTLSGEKMLLLQVEESESYVKLIKKVKNKVRGVTFSDILLNAISRSISQYFEKSSKGNIPDIITAVVPTCLNTEPAKFNFEKCNENTTLGNRFSVAMLELPLLSSKTSHLESLERIKFKTDGLRNSFDYQVNYWLLNIVSAVLPVSLLRPLLESSQSTLIVSNLPGPDGLTVFGGHPLVDVSFWVPHKGSTGLGISILSYDKRLQIGLNVDKVLISEKQDIRDIMRNIFESLILLNDEAEGIV